MTAPDPCDHCFSFSTPRDYLRVARRDLLTAKSIFLYGIARAFDAISSLALAASTHFKVESDIIDGRLDLEEELTDSDGQP